MTSQNCLVFISRLQEMYTRLTATEKRIADYMMKDPQAVLSATAEMIAEATQTSAATVIRFCKSAGYSGLTELKLSLRTEYEAIVSDNGQNLEVFSNDSVDVIKQKVLGYHQIVINTMLASRDEAVFSLAVDAIVKAGRILVIGEGGSRSSAYNLFDILLQLDLPCELACDSVFEIMQVGSMRPGDVVIGVSYSGRFRNTVESFQLAKEKGLTTIGLIGETKSTAMEYVDIHLNTHVEKNIMYASAIFYRVSEQAVVEILYALLSARLKKRLEGGLFFNKYTEIRRYPV